MTETNELLNYIESNLQNGFVHEKSLRQTKLSEISLYRHKQSGKRLLVRRSKLFNDNVYRILRKVADPHLPDVYEVCVDESGLTVLEEFIEGETLEAKIKNNPPDKKTACRLAQQICMALSHLHKLEIIHRDIKPSNIMIKPDGTAVLIDFGIARTLSDDSEKDTAILGTLGYAAPEQFGLAQSEAATDLFAVGVLLNMMLVGVHPSVKTATGRLGKIIRKATSTQMSGRYQSAEQMYRALKRPI